ncbi:Geraniol dehydrogenase [Pseudomonas sp. 37 R 15]|nr:Geraniol dehydrogenase [Pseudomonas sp. 37 R 15]
MSHTALMPIEVKVAVLREAGGKLQFERAELAVPRPDEVRVRIVATGVCHTLRRVFATPIWSYATNFFRHRCPSFWATKVLGLLRP